MKLSTDEIIKASGAKILKNNGSIRCFGFSTDTRTVQKGELYIPLKGENFDGENFIPAALKSGAAGYFTSDKDKIVSDAEIVFYVEDTKEAYLKLANFYKNKTNPYTIMITGSSGKTTVKEMMYSVFSLAGETVKSVLNHNNEIGLCQTLSATDTRTCYLIVEAGMRGPGEIELISKYCEPDIAVIVNVGTAHIGRLGSEENIARAKFEITKYLKPSGILISHNNRLIKKINDNKHKTVYFDINDNNITLKEMTAQSCLFEYKGNDYKINVPGIHNVQNALGVIETALNSGIDVSVIQEGLENFTPIEKRWNKIKAGGFNVINDCYNSNPESVKAAIETFLRYTDGVKVLVLGDMGELGQDEELYHSQTGKFIEKFDCDYLLTVGKLAFYMNPLNIKTYHFETNIEVSDFIKENIEKDSNILLKASRFMKFEEIIKELENDNGN